MLRTEILLSLCSLKLCLELFEESHSLIHQSCNSYCLVIRLNFRYGETHLDGSPAPNSECAHHVMACA